MRDKTTMTRIAQPILKLAKYEAVKEGIYLKRWLENAVMKVIRDKAEEQK